MQVNHNVEIIGWGETASGVKYWIGRNSWGTYWGEGGFFRLGRGYGMDKNLRVERDCQWMVPEWGDLDDVLDGTRHSSGSLLCPHPMVSSASSVLSASSCALLWSLYAMALPSYPTQSRAVVSCALV